MAKSRRRTYKKRQVEVDLAELQTIVGATTERPLTEEEQQKLVASHQLLADLILPEFQSETTAALHGNGEKKPKEDKPRKSARKNAGRRPRSDFKGAELVRRSHPEYQVGQPCPCGQCNGKLYLNKRVSYFRHFIGQAPIRVVLYELEQLRSNGCQTVYVAPLPEGVGPEEYDATAVSTIALNRYGVGLPFYRQAKQLDVMGTPISPSTQYKIVSDALSKIEPVHAYLIELAAQGKLAYFDDTSMKILDFDRPKGDKRTGIFTTGLVSVHDAFEIALLFTGREHAGENREKLLKRRDPDLDAMILMSDALAANFVNLDSEKELVANCLAHGRRNFVKILDSFPEDCQHVISSLGEVYHNDVLAKENGYDDEARLIYHQIHSGPIMGTLKAWLDEQIHQKKVEPNSGLGKAIAYMRSHWTALTLFLKVAGAPIDNNVAYAARGISNIMPTPGLCRFERPTACWPSIFKRNAA